MNYRTEQLAYAVALSAAGLFMAAVVVVRLVTEAVHVVVRPARCPDLIPDWVDDGSATW